MTSHNKKSQRVAIIIDSLCGGGAESVMLTLASSLVSLGHSVDIFSLRHEQDYDLPKRVAVHFLFDRRYKIKGFYNGKRLAELFENQLREIERQFGEFDLFLANLEESYKVASYASIGPVFYVVHNSIVESLARAKRMGPVKYFYLRFIYSRLSGKHLVTVSKGVENEIRSTRVIRPASVQTVYNPFNAALIEQAACELVPGLPDSPYIIHVGRAARQKRHDILFRALKRIDQRVKLVCLASRTEKLERLAKKYGVFDRVILPGFQKNPYPWIQRAELLVLSSDFEGFPSVLVEALLCGTLPVATNCPFGANEILVGNLASQLVNRRDPKALASQVNIVLARTKPETLEIEALLNKVEAGRVARQYLALAKVCARD